MTCPACQIENEDSATFCRVCGAELSSGLKPGTLVHGRYEIQKLLGRGGMGVVYKAHDRSLDETVAIKLLRAEVAASSMARRFRSEIKLARKVGHRNVCRIFEYGEDAGFQYICMEYIEGVDLRAVLRRGRLQRLEAFDLSLQVMAGLEAIHDGGIIHRDLKTANIMRDTRGVAKLMDFGIAKEWGVSGGTGATQTGQIIGTPDYMSPEQARGTSIDFRSDIYALGIVIFELFTGQVPFRSDTPLATILKHLSEPPPLEDPDVVRALGALVPVVRCALAKEPGRRFSNVGDMATAFRTAEPTLGSSGVTPIRLPVVTAAASRTPTTYVPAVQPTVMPDDVEPTIGMEGAPEAETGGATQTSIDLGTPARTRALPRPAPPRAAAKATPPATRGPLLGAIGGGLIVLGVLGAWLGLRPGDKPAPSPSPAPSAIVATTLRAIESPTVRIAGPSVPLSPAAMPLPAVRASEPPRVAARPLPAATSAPTTIPSSAPQRAEPTPIAESAAPQAVAPAPPVSTPVPQPSLEPAPPVSLPPAVTKRGDLVAPGPGVVQPQVLSVARPAYPSAAKKLNKDSTVLVRVLVDEEGKVQQAEILLGDASGFGFNEAALQAAKKTTFRPPSKYGVAVKMWTNLPVVFSKP